MGGTRSLVLLAACSRALQPDILLLIADDVGFNGVGYQSDYTNVSNGFLTPRLDALAAESLKLSSFYVLPLCAPTRAALLTGRYPTRYGLSAFNADWGKPWGLPANETLLPEVLKAANYTTGLLGKWHLGSHRDAALPQSRASTSSAASILAVSRAPSKTFPDGCHRCVTGYDFHDGAAPAFDMNGTYSAGARGAAVAFVRTAQRPFYAQCAFQNVHEPLEVPARFADRDAAALPARERVYAGMVSALDEAAGIVLDALPALDETVVVFFSDNGAMADSAAPSGARANYFKGGKTLTTEGGTRAPCFVRYPPLLSPGWSASLLKAPKAALRYDDFKLSFEFWSNRSGAALYDLAADPMETSDVANRHPASCATSRRVSRRTPRASAALRAVAAVPGTSLSLGSPRRLSGSAMDALAEYRATTFDGLRECRETLQELGKEELDEEDFDLVFSLTLADPAEHFKYWKLEPSRAERRWQRAARVAKATSRWKRAAARRPKALADAEARLLVCCFQGLNRATRTTPVVSAATVAALADDVGGDRVSASQLRSFVATRLAGHLAPFLPGQDKGDSTSLQRSCPRMVHAPPAARGALRPRAGGLLLRSGPARVVDLDVFRGIVRRLPGFPSRGDVDAFAALLDANGGAADGLIGLDEFGDAVAAWVAFAVVDDDASGSLSAAELKFLLWVQAGATARSRAPTREYTAAKPIIKQKHDEILNYATVVVRHQHKDPAACARRRRRRGPASATWPSCNRGPPRF
ncbi:hypothetical protein JL720_12296 [Aureococcus anophagefferens]|nr:hypothetical protein JL720_12296 [Aureococcus anophagefferens]